MLHAPEPETPDAAGAPHVLVVDDDPALRRMVERALVAEGYRVSLAASGAAMRAVFDAPHPSRGSSAAASDAGGVDLVLLDVVMPFENGLDLAASLRRSREDVGIIMVTGRDDAIDRVLGLEIGADDYVAKPFHLRELVARVRSVLRRRKPARAEMAPSSSEGAVMFDGWRLDFARRDLTDAAGRSVPLTTAEFELLAVFARHPGRVLDRERLTELTKGRGRDALDRTIDAQISRLRRKIEADPSVPTVIKSVRGVGYVFTPRISP